MLREVTVKIGLERIEVEVLLDSRITGQVMSLKFARKQGFKLKKIERLIYMRNVDSFFNKKGLIEHKVEVNIYYQEDRERIEISVIGRQKWSIILGMLWLACHNSKIYWRTRVVKIIRCLEKYGKQ